MALFNSRYVVQVFWIVCITNNILNAAPSIEYLRAEANECVRQIHMAFGNKTSSKDCLRYAVKFYIKGQNFTIQRKTDSSDEMLLSQLKYKIQNYENENQNNASSSKSTPENITRVYSFGDLMSSNKAVERENDPIESENDSSDDSTEMANSRAKRTKRTQYMEYPKIHNKVEPENIPSYHTGDKNYAKMYHQALENMIAGTDIPKRKEFCTTYFYMSHGECMVALIPFGNSGMSAVKKAFGSYVLADCLVLQNFDPDYVYIYKYMEVISEKCKTKSPSKKPWVFCEELILDGIL